eukprot:CRZ05327.1 hypothetical protein [Spongospora subterranea]
MFANCGRLRRVSKGDAIGATHQRSANSSFIVLTGSLIVHDDDTTQPAIIGGNIATLHPGDIFLSDIDSPVDRRVLAVSDSIVLGISQNHIHQYIERRHLHQIANVLRRCWQLSKLSDAILIDIASTSRLEPYSHNQIVVQQGGPLSNDVFMVASGSARVVIEMPSRVFGPLRRKHESTRIASYLNSPVVGEFDSDLTQLTCGEGAFIDMDSLVIGDMFGYESLGNCSTYQCSVITISPLRQPVQILLMSRRDLTRILSPNDLSAILASGRMSKTKAKVLDDLEKGNRWVQYCQAVGDSGKGDRTVPLARDLYGSGSNRPLTRSRSVHHIKAEIGNLIDSIHLDSIQGAPQQRVIDSLTMEQVRQYGKQFTIEDCSDLLLKSPQSIDKIIAAHELAFDNAQASTSAAEK